jgi:hypothetical protein
MGYFNYKSDDGNTYRMKLDSSNATSLGGVTATATNWYPRGWVGRKILCFNAEHGRRSVTAPDPADAHWVGTANILPLEVVGSILPVDYTITARIGEKRTSRG